MIPDEIRLGLIKAAFLDTVEDIFRHQRMMAKTAQFGAARNVLKEVAEGAAERTLTRPGGAIIRHTPTSVPNVQVASPGLTTLRREALPVADVPPAKAPAPAPDPGVPTPAKAPAPAPDPGVAPTAPATVPGGLPDPRSFLSPAQRAGSALHRFGVPLGVGLGAFALTGNPLLALGAGFGARSLGGVGAKVRGMLPGAKRTQEAWLKQEASQLLESGAAKSTSAAEAMALENLEKQMANPNMGARLGAEFAEAAKPNYLMGGALAGAGALGAGYLGLKGGTKMLLGDKGSQQVEQQGLLPSAVAMGLGGYGTYEALKALGVDNPLLLYGGSALGGAKAPGLLSSITGL